MQNAYQLETRSTQEHENQPPAAGTKKLRIAHLVSHPVQYYAPLYRALVQRPDIDLTVYFYSGESANEYFDTEFGLPVKWDVPLLDGYPYRIFPGSETRRVGQGMDLRPTWPIFRELLHSRPDVIWVNGYQFLNTWLAVAVGWVLQRPVFLRDEQNLLPQRSLWKRILKRLVMPLLYRRVWGFYIGQNSRAFFSHYQTRNERLFPAFYCVDNHFFRSHRAVLNVDRPAVRRLFGIKDSAPVILFSGKLIDKKKPQLLLEAFRQVRQTAPAHLLFVGEGALRSSLQEKIDAQHIPDVHWAGFLNQSELSKAYVAADIFVLPSAYNETWGLVVNEAMNFELPIVVSDQVGCAADLVEEGRNGHVFPTGDIEQLTVILSRLVSDERLRCRYGKRSLELIDEFAVDRVASQIAFACKRASMGKPVQS